MLSDLPLQLPLVVEASPAKELHQTSVEVSSSHFPPFQFIEEEPGEEHREKSIKTIRSHVTRGYHRQRREKEIKKFQLRNHERKLLVARPTEENGQGHLFVQPALCYKDNLIPYTFFSQNGPVLELPRTSRPFYDALSKEKYNPIVFPRQSVWMPNAIVPDIFRIRGPILDHVVVDWISNTSNCFQYRADTIKWVYDRLANVDTAIEDETMGAIMTLTMWESYRTKSDPVDLVTHINGLEQLVKLRGGLDAIPSDLALKLALFDHIIAVMTLREPRFPLQLRAMLFPPVSPSHCFHDSPIYGSLPFQFFIVNTNADERIAAILTEARECTEEAEAGFISLTARRPSKLDFGVSEITEDLNPILQVIFLASRIFMAALHSHSPKDIFASPFFGAYLELISKNLDATRSDEFWIDNSGIRLWVLLVSAACAVYRQERGYYMMFLARVGIFQGSRETDESIRRWCHLFNKSPRIELNHQPMMSRINTTDLFLEYQLCL